MLKHIYNKCLQPEPNLEGLEHGKVEDDVNGLKICLMCGMVLDDVDVGCISRECFVWHKWGLNVGLITVSTFTFWFGTGNGFSIAGDGVLETGNISVGDKDDVQGILVGNGLRRDTGIFGIYDVGIGCKFNGGKQGGVFIGM